MCECLCEHSNEALPQPISKRKDKEHKKKKSKTILAVNAEADIILKSAGTPPEVVSYNVAAPTKPILEKKPGWLQFKIGGNKCTLTVRFRKFFFSSFEVVWSQLSSSYVIGIIREGSRI